MSINLRDRYVPDPISEELEALYNCYTYLLHNGIEPSFILIPEQLYAELKNEKI